MNRKKLAVAATALVVAMSGGLLLANPVAAAPVNRSCGTSEWAQANRDALAYCQANGYTGGTAGDCSAGTGWISFTVNCYNN